jgi:hypothetical protein
MNSDASTAPDLSRPNYSQKIACRSAQLRPIAYHPRSEMRRDLRPSKMIVHAHSHGVDSIPQAEHGNGRVVQGIEQRRAVVSEVVVIVFQG